MRTELVEDLQKYKKFIEVELLQTISLDKLMSLFKEMSSTARKEIAVDLHLPSVRTSKNMPIILFIKEIRQYIKSRQDHFNRKYTLVTSVIKQLMVILEKEDDNSLKSFLNRGEEIAAEHGYWHFYWSLYFHPGRTEQEAIWKQAMEELKQGDWLAEGTAVECTSDNPAVESDNEIQTAIAPPDKLLEHEQQYTEMKKKLHYEIYLRKKAETSLGKAEKQIHRMNRLLSDAESKLHFVQQELSQVQQEKGVHISRLEAQIAQDSEELKMVRHECGKLQKEAEMMKQELAVKDEQTESVRRDLATQEEKLEQASKQVSSLRVDNKNLAQQCTIWRKSTAATGTDRARPKLLSSSIEELIQLLYTDVENILHVTRNTAIHAGKKARQKMQMSLELIDELERFMDLRNGLHLEHTDQDSGRSSKVITEYDAKPKQSKPPIESMSHSESACALESHNTAVLDRDTHIGEDGELGAAATFVDLSTRSDDNGVGGTFLRRDHGGSIVLETGHSFNITESLVLQHHLQHEAGVLCRPKQNDPTQYDIELMLQGDDSNSPIVQYDGYVQLGEHFTWYCVDLNEPQRRFPLHWRDVAIRTPKDGDPCLFNVEIGKQVARLSRVYRTQSVSELEAKRPAISAGQGGARTVKVQAKKEYEKREPFLEGHQITIVGGLKKWFEVVVAETGAILVHENGKNPKRIFHDLKRSSALFLLLTATSHQAYWDCVEIAKQNQIPFYFIEGSKSNLRHLLWNHQEQIIAHAKAN